MLMKAYVQARLSLPGFHHWPDAPEAVVYLRYPHRHLFVIRATKAVSHGDREVEFHLLKGQVEFHLRERYPFGLHAPGATEPAYNFGTSSCEQIGEDLLRTLDLAQVSVFEDDENGAIVARDEADT
jgi:hypothetical protein